MKLKIAGSMHNAMKHAIQLHNASPDGHHSLNTHVPEGCCCIFWSHTVMSSFSFHYVVLFSCIFRLISQTSAQVPTIPVSAVQARRPCLQHIGPAIISGRCAFCAHIRQKAHTSVAQCTTPAAAAGLPWVSPRGYSRIHTAEPL